MTSFLITMHTCPMVQAQVFFWGVQFDLKVSNSIGIWQDWMSLELRMKDGFQRSHVLVTGPPKWGYGRRGKA